MKYLIAFCHFLTTAISAQEVNQKKKRLSDSELKLAKKYKEIVHSDT
jgi:hypothetical protein